MDRLKKGMRFVQVAMLFTGFGFCSVALRAIDDKIVYDAVSHEKIGMVHMLGILLAICAVIWTAAWLAYRMFCLMRNNDPDIGTDEDEEYEFDQDSFPSSPNLPR